MTENRNSENFRGLLTFIEDYSTVNIQYDDDNGDHQEETETGALNTESVNLQKCEAEPVSLQTEVQEQIYRLTRASILTLFKWHPVYSKFVTSERDNFINSTHNLMTKCEKSTLMIFKILTKVYDLCAMIDNVLIEVPVTQIDEKLSKFSWIKVDKSRCSMFMRSLPKRSYPIVYLYTMDWGMKLWFSRKIQVSVLSSGDSRMLQYSPLEGQISDIIGSSLKSFNNRLSNVRSQNHPDQLVTLYQLFNRHLITCLSLELMRISIRRTDLHYTGVVYRGEIMTQDQFQHLQHKSQSKEYIGKVKLFALGISSTSRDLNTALSFLSSGSSKNRSDKTVKVLHSVNIMRPSEEVIAKFDRNFPSTCLISKALDIREFSIFPNESEIIVTDLMILTLSMEKFNDEDIWLTTSVAVGLQPFMDSKDLLRTIVDDSSENSAQESSNTAAEKMGLSEENYNCQLDWNALSIDMLYGFAVEHYEKNEDDRSELMKQLLYQHRQQSSHGN